MMRKHVWLLLQSAMITGAIASFAIAVGGVPVPSQQPSTIVPVLSQPLGDRDGQSGAVPWQQQSTVRGGAVPASTTTNCPKG